MTIKIILLAGWSQAGKDTAADYLVEKYGFKKFAFADAPKVAVAAKYNFPIGWTKTQEGKALQVHTENGLRTVRDLIIEYANSERAKNPYAWAEVTANEIKEVVANGNVTADINGDIHLVISDWRLIDELIGLQRELVSLKPNIYPILIKRDGQIISPVPDKTEYSLLGFPFYRTIRNTFATYIPFYPPLSEDRLNNYLKSQQDEFIHNIKSNLVGLLPPLTLEQEKNRILSIANST